MLYYYCFRMAPAGFGAGSGTAILASDPSPHPTIHWVQIFTVPALGRFSRPDGTRERGGQRRRLAEGRRGQRCEDVQDGIEDEALKEARLRVLQYKGFCLLYNINY
jgi:hypothetical protein